jgi:phosphatidylcholine synthase
MVWCRRGAPREVTSAASRCGAIFPQRFDDCRTLLRFAAAWLVHLYTASGIVLALLAARAIFEHEYRRAFVCLALQIVVDATDGVLARLARVTEVTPGFRGAHLDDIVDYAAYVFVPALLVWHAELVPAGWSFAVCSAMLVSSAYGFARADAKTSDHFFTGFPSYWNIVAFYLFTGGLQPTVNATVLLLLAALVFVPIRFVYPSRTTILRGPTLWLGGAWAILMFMMIDGMPAVSIRVWWLSMVFPLYYTVLSLVLMSGRHASAKRGI